MSELIQLKLQILGLIVGLCGQHPPVELRANQLNDSSALCTRQWYGCIVEGPTFNNLADRFDARVFDHEFARCTRLPAPCTLSGVWNDRLGGALCGGAVNVKEEKYLK